MLAANQGAMRERQLHVQGNKLSVARITNASQTHNQRFAVLIMIQMYADSATVTSEACH